jgi:Protein of unknown function (DUF2892)
MFIERYLRLIAGFFVTLSVAPGYWVHPAWFLFTAFVGLNLFQSAFTNWRPMMNFLGKAGVQEANHSMPKAPARLDSGLEVSTINRELQVLRRMFRLAQEWGRVQKALPSVKMLPGKNTANVF